MKITEIISEDVSRRGFLKGIAGTALAGASGSAFSSNSISEYTVQQQYDLQFRSTLGRDTIVKIIPRKAGGNVAITARNRYFLIIGSKESQAGFILMRVPPDILAGNSSKQSDSNKQETEYKPSEGYAKRVVARISPNIKLHDSGNGSGPPVTVEIIASSDGTITGRKIIKSSGDTAWDNVILKAVDSAQVLPRDITGVVPKSITVTFDGAINETSPEAIAKISQLTRK